MWRKIKRYSRKLRNFWVYGRLGFKSDDWWVSDSWSFVDQKLQDVETYLLRDGDIYAEKTNYLKKIKILRRYLDFMRGNLALGDASVRFKKAYGVEPDYEFKWGEKTKIGTPCTLEFKYPDKEVNLKVFHDLEGKIWEDTEKQFYKLMRKFFTRLDF